MNKLDIERSLRNSIEQETPDLLASLMAAPVKKLPCEDYIVKQRPVKNTSAVGRFAAAFGSIAMVCLVCLTFLSNHNNQTTWEDMEADTFISIDVNPSIEMLADENNMIMELRGLNEEAETVLQDVDDDDKDLDQVVSSIVESMTEHGYLKPEVRNSILVSVENEDSEKADHIKGTITDDIYKTLDKTEIDSVVLTQDVKKTKELEKEAEALNISVGKMSLIQNLVQKDSDLDVQQMAGMSIQDISNLAQERKVDITEVVDYGKVEEKDTHIPAGVPVEKTEKPTESVSASSKADSQEHTSADTSAAGSEAPVRNNGTTGQTSASTQTPSMDYEVNDTPKPSASTSNAASKEDPQVVDQEPNVVAKPVDKPTAAPADKNNDSYEIQESTDSGEIVE